MDDYLLYKTNPIYRFQNLTTDIVCAVNGLGRPADKWNQKTRSGECEVATCPINHCFRLVDLLGPSIMIKNLIHNCLKGTHVLPKKLEKTHTFFHRFGHPFCGPAIGVHNSHKFGHPNPQPFSAPADNLLSCHAPGPSWCNPADSMVTWTTVFHIRHNWSFPYCHGGTLW